MRKARNYVPLLVVAGALVLAVVGVVLCGGAVLGARSYLTDGRTTSRLVITGSSTVAPVAAIPSPATALES